MAESEDIQSVVNQVAREADAGPRSGANTTCLREEHKQVF